MKPTETLCSSEEQPTVEDLREVYYTLRQDHKHGRHGECFKDLALEKHQRVASLFVGGIPGLCGYKV